MRAMRISLGIFIAVMLIVAVGTVGVVRVQRELAFGIARLPEKAELAAADAEELLEQWQAARWWLRLCLHRSQFRAVEEGLVELSLCAAMGEEAQVEYVLARRALELAVEEMGVVWFVL